MGTVAAVECVIITAVAVAFGLGLLLRILGRRRPELSIGRPLAVGYLLRLLVIGVVSLSPIGSTIRGGDEIGFMASAHRLAALSWTSAQWLPTNHSSFLHVLVFAAQIKLLGSPAGALRIAQVGIALAGVLLIAVSVHDIAGPRAARLTAWLLSLEVASLFFNELLQKDPLMELASGLVVFGATQVWAKIQLRGVAIMLIGGLIALATRQYVGWFLIAASVLVTLHASVRQLSGSLRSVAVIGGVIVIMLVALPVIVQATSPQSLQANLQSSQTANAVTTRGNGAANGNNLALEQVDFSTRGAILTNLPGRIVDVLLRPYPWQVGDVNQMLGVVGSLIALACFYLLIRYALLSRGRLFQRAGPLLYPFLFLLVAYALSVGNAGTGFRYRTHLVTLAVAAMLVLRHGVLETKESPKDLPFNSRSSDPQHPASKFDRAHSHGVPAF